MRPERIIWRLSDHRISRIAVGQAEEFSGFLNQGGKLAGFLDVFGHRLFADDIDSHFQEGFRHRVMKLWRGGNHYRVDAIDPFRLLSGHLLEIGVNPICGQELVLA